MRPLALLLLLALFVPLFLASASHGLAGTLRLTLPSGVTSAMPLAIYAADEAAGRPVDRLEPPGTVTLPDGDYVLGVGDFPARLGRITVPATGESVVALSTLVVAAPAGSPPRHTLFNEADGQLVAPVAYGTALAVPPGRYLLRRDLSTEVVQVLLQSDVTETVALGAIQPVYATPEVPRAVGMAVEQAGTAVRMYAQPWTAPEPLLPGTYRVTTSAAVTPVPVTVAAGAMTTVPLAWLRLAAGPDDRRPFMVQAPDGSRLAHWAGDTAARDLLLPAPPERVRVITEGGGPKAEISLTPSDSSASGVSLWRLGDILVPDQPLRPVLADDHPPILLPGGSVPIALTVADVAQLRIHLSDRQSPLVERDVGKRALSLAVPLPENPDPPWSETEDLVVHLVPSTGETLTGIIPGLTRHKPLAAAVGDLRTTERSATTIALAWSSPATGMVVGYNVYRNAFPYPINGTVPVPGPTFTDIGLSRSQALTHRVCPVDPLGLEGPCTTLKTSTTASARP